MPRMGSGEVGNFARWIGLLPSGSGDRRAHQESLLLSGETGAGAGSRPSPREQIRPEHGGWWHGNASPRKGTTGDGSTAVLATLMPTELRGVKCGARAQSSSAVAGDSHAPANPGTKQAARSRQAAPAKRSFARCGRQGEHDDASG